MSAGTLRLRGARATAFGALLIAVVTAVPRVATLDRQDLWADEIFSLAMATGHSLEHPAAVADAALGDYVEHPGPLPAAAYRAYLEHEAPAADLQRVVRAVRLSDTSPPLYYVLLHGWTRLSGTGDGALRGFSVLWALACLPLLWSLGAQFGGRPAAWLACVLFAAAPVAIRYSTEGRMYSMLWFFVLLTAWAALRLHRRGASVPVLLLWTVASAAGLLTHYFYLFVWMAVLAWLVWQPGRCDRRWIGLCAAGVGVLVLPWYIQLPASLSGWRVTHDWLTHRPNRYRPLHAPLELGWSFFSADVWSSRATLGKRRILLLLLTAAVLLWNLDWRRRGRRLALLLLWIAAACVGPLLFDLLRGTYASAISRYALAGLPAAFLLVAAASVRLPGLVRNLPLLVLLVMWVPAYDPLYTSSERSGASLGAVARFADEHGRESDVILLHGIPSGILGVARYMRSATPIASWVGQLGQRRVPEDLDAFTAGRERVFLIKAHHVGAPAPQEEFLRAHAKVIDERRIGSSTIVLFARRGQDGFVPLRLREPGDRTDPHPPGELSAAEPAGAATHR